MLTETTRPSASGTIVLPPVGPRCVDATGSARRTHLTSVDRRRQSPSTRDGARGNIVTEPSRSKWWKGGEDGMRRRQFEQHLRELLTALVDGWGDAEKAA